MELHAQWSFIYGFSPREAATSALPLGSVLRIRLRCPAGGAMIALQKPVVIGLRDGEQGRDNRRELCIKKEKKKRKSFRSLQH